jgi:hypothetical protein
MIQAKVGAFNVSTAAAGNTVAVSGVGFQPKVIFFWWSGITGSADAASGGNHKRGFGVAASPTSRWEVDGQAENAQGISDCDSSFRTDACIATRTTTNTTDGLMDLQSMDSDGFTLVIDDAFATDIRVHYLALGGDDITDVATGTLTEPSSTGNQDITSLSFQPNFVLFGSISDASGSPAAQNDSPIMVGAAASSNQRGVLNTGAANGEETMDAKSYLYGGECVGMFSGTLGSTNGRADLVQFLSNGFRLNWLEVSGTSHIVAFVAIKGGRFRMGGITIPTTSSTQIAVSGLGFSPKATLLLSHGKAQDTQDTVTADDRYIVGAFTGTSERGCQSAFDEDAQASSDIEMMVEHDQCLARLLTGASVEGLVDVQSIDSDGFTLVTESTSGSSWYAVYISVGDTVDVRTKALTSDAILKKAQAKTLTSDAVLRKSQTKTAAVDGVLKKLAQL